jgi:hypothetical protein
VANVWDLLDDKSESKTVGCWRIFYTGYATRDGHSAYVWFLACTHAIVQIEKPRKSSSGHINRVKVRAAELSGTQRRCMLFHSVSSAVSVQVLLGA